MELIPHIKVWLSTPDHKNIVGRGRCRLLKAIDETGSLSAAAETLNISYRKAWGDLKKAEQHVGLKLVDKARGGAGGGRTVLTAAGTDLLNAYMSLVEDIERYTAENCDRLLRGALHDEPHPDHED